MDERAGRLQIVSTPIGNLGDISHRAVETLRSADAILAEDTRYTRRLLAHFSIVTPLAAYHQHNEARATPPLIERLRAGDALALVSDAGTPLLSDPGARLVRTAIEAGILVTVVPGASALLAALVVSGLEASRFTFFGFLPRSGRERKQTLDEVRRLQHTSVIYEAPGRVAASLEALEQAGAGERVAVVARELTKRFEDVRRGTVALLARYYRGSPPRGEVVILIAGASPERLDEEGLRTVSRALKASGVTARDVARRLVNEHGSPRNIAYRLAQEP